MSYTVIYRTGTPKACQWYRLAECWHDQAQAEQQANNVRANGYHAEVRATRELDSIGLPIGWDSKSVDFDEDYYEVSRYMTTWRRKGPEK